MHILLSSVREKVDHCRIVSFSVIFLYSRSERSTVFNAVSAVNCLLVVLSVVYWDVTPTGERKVECGDVNWQAKIVTNQVLKSWLGQIKRSAFTSTKDHAVCSFHFLKMDALPAGDSPISRNIF